MNKLDLSVIIPIYNEMDNLLDLYNSLLPALDKTGKSYEVILVNDGSSDSSSQVLVKIAANDKRIVVVEFSRNFGQTAAMMAGIDIASGNILIPMDGDMQNDPNDIELLLEKIDEGYDVVSGWRKDRKDSSLKRNLPSRIANKLISYVSGVHLHDYGCSLKAYKKEVLEDVRIYGEMHRFIPIYATWEGARVTEISVTHHPRTKGVSKYGLERTFKVLLDLCVVKFLSKYLVKPIYVFGGVSFLFLFFSFITFLLAVILKLVYATSFVQTPLPLFAGIAFMCSIMSLLMGLLAEITMRVYFEAQDKKSYKVKHIINSHKV